MKNKSEDWDFKDLVTPEHDRLIMQLLDPETIKALFDTPLEVVVSEIKTEVPVSTGSNYFILGYIDITAKVMLCGKEHEFAETSWGTFVCKECRCRQEEPAERCLRKSYEIAFEVKPKIDSFGAIVRQFNKYKTVTKMDRWYIATSDKKVEKFKEFFKGQGIGVFFMDTQKKDSVEKQMGFNL